MRSLHRAFAGVLIRVALYQKQFLTGTAVFAEERPAVRPDADYQRLQLLESWIDGQEEALGALARLLAGEGSIEGHRIPNTFSHTILNHSAIEEEISGWCSWAYVANADPIDRNRSLNLDREPVVNKGLAPYFSPADAVQNWVFNSYSSHPLNQVPYSERFLVLLPDTRARFCSGRWVGSRLAIQIETNVPTSDVELQINLVGSRTQGLHMPISGESIQIEVPDDARQLTLYLVHSNGDLICQRRLSAGYRYFGGAEDEVPECDVAKDLREGESDIREFKPFISPFDAKESEVVRTVVAFANTGGGRLIIGVNDEGIPMGLAEARRQMKDNRSPIGSQLARIKKLIRESTKPVPEISCSQVDVHGQPVVVIDVPKSAGVCSTQDNRVYVRKGATSRPADSLTELPSMYAAVASSVRGVWGLSGMEDQ
jgi:hypothetical protein